MNRRAGYRTPAIKRAPVKTPAANPPADQVGLILVDLDGMVLGHTVVSRAQFDRATSDKDRAENIAWSILRKLTPGSTDAHS